jgi:hypothetical protein
MIKSKYPWNDQPENASHSQVMRNPCEASLGSGPSPHDSTRLGSRYRLFSKKPRSAALATVERFGSVLVNPCRSSRHPRAGGKRLRSYHHLQAGAAPAFAAFPQCPKYNLVSTTAGTLGETEPIPVPIVSTDPRQRPPDQGGGLLEGHPHPRRRPKGLAVLSRAKPSLHSIAAGHNFSEQSSDSIVFK